MLVTTYERVAQHITDVTPEQIGRCARIIGTDGTTYYVVVNERDERDECGNLIEYSVKYSPKYGFTCTCKSGREGFKNVAHPSRVCKHVRWSLACTMEERAYMRELAEKEEAARDKEAASLDGEADTRRPHLLIINGKAASLRDYARVMNAQPPRPSEGEIKQDQRRYSPRPFRIER